jgi:hypothetical protein
MAYKKEFLKEFKILQCGKNYDINIPLMACVTEIYKSERTALKSLWPIFPILKKTKTKVGL